MDLFLFISTEEFSLTTNQLIKLFLFNDSVKNTYGGVLNSYFSRSRTRYNELNKQNLAT